MKTALLPAIALAIAVAACGRSAPAATPTTEPSPLPTQPPATDAVPTAAAPAATATAPAGQTPTDSPAAASPTATAAFTEPPAATPTIAATPTPATAFMTLRDFEIVPRQLTISAGTRVVFLIQGAPGVLHQPYSSFANSTDLSGLFEAPANLGDGATYAFTFTQPGTYVVRCGFHPVNMVATIEVTP